MVLKAWREAFGNAYELAFHAANNNNDLFYCRYPYSFVGLGPILSATIMAITCVLAYVSATYMVEAIAMANS
jgi:hypothetical protein